MKTGVQGDGADEDSPASQEAGAQRSVLDPFVVVVAAAAGGVDIAPLSSPVVVVAAAAAAEVAASAAAAAAAEVTVVSDMSRSIFASSSVSDLVP